MILYIDTKIIQKLNKATPFRSVFPIPSIKNIFQEIYINENLKYIIEMKSHTVEFISISPTSYTRHYFHLIIKQINGVESGVGRCMKASSYTSVSSFQTHISLINRLLRCITQTLFEFMQISLFSLNYSLLELKTYNFVRS